MVLSIIAQPNKPKKLFWILLNKIQTASKTLKFYNYDYWCTKGD